MSTGATTVLGRCRQVPQTSSAGAGRCHICFGQVLAPRMSQTPAPLPSGGSSKAPHPPRIRTSQAVHATSDEDYSGKAPARSRRNTGQSKETHPLPSCQARCESACERVSERCSFVPPGRHLFTTVVSSRPVLRRSKKESAVFPRLRPSGRQGLGHRSSSCAFPRPSVNLHCSSARHLQKWGAFGKPLQCQSAIPLVSAGGRKSRAAALLWDREAFAFDSSGYD